MQDTCKPSYLRIVKTNQRSSFATAFLTGIVVVGLLLVVAYVLTKHTQKEGIQDVKLPMAEIERAYLSQIRFAEPKMSRAANFLNQEVTFIFVTVENSGPREILQMEITLEFRDAFNQVVLRDVRRAWRPQAAPLAGRQSREFQFSFEHVPIDWNRTYPSLRITGLLLK